MEAGKPAVWRGELPEACYQKTVLRVRAFDSESVLPEFLRLIFLADCLSGKFARLAPGVGIVHITAERLIRWLIPVAPVAEQCRIVAEVERLESQINSSATACERNLARLARLRQSVLKWAFEGKLVDQDPTDEPASVLLDRIRAERAAQGDAKPRRRGRPPKGAPA